MALTRTRNCIKVFFKVILLLLVVISIVDGGSFAYEALGGGSLVGVLASHASDQEGVQVVVNAGGHPLEIVIVVVYCWLLFLFFLLLH